VKNPTTSPKIFSHPGWVRVWCIVLLALAFLVPSSSAHADIGPKPSMNFTIKYEIPEQPILDAQLIECEDAACTQGIPLPNLGPQHFKCDSPTACDSLAYGYAEFHKLALTYADRIRESKVFKKQAFAASYSVTVFSDRLDVQENIVIDKKNCNCTSAGLLTIVLEMLIATLYFNAFGLPRHLTGWVPVASLLTLPFVWFAFPQLPISDFTMIGASESFAVVAEALFLYWISGRSLSFKHAVALSLIMNAGSFAAGLLL
jgi:hypothetical protein